MAHAFNACIPYVTYVTQTLYLKRFIMNHTRATSHLTSKLDLRLHAQRHAFCFELGQVVSGEQLHQLLNGTKLYRQGEYTLSELSFKCAHAGCHAAVTPQDYGPYCRTSETSFRKVVGGTPHSDDCPLASPYKKTVSDHNTTADTPRVPKHLEAGHTIHRNRSNTPCPVLSEGKRRIFDRASLTHTSQLSGHLVKARMTVGQACIYQPSSALGR